MAAEAPTLAAILARVQQDGVRRAATALRKPPVPSRLLQELAELTEPLEAQRFVAAYPLSPSHLLESLARTAQDPEVFPFLATNPRTPPHLLSEFAAHENPEVRTYVATHPQLAARELLNLAQDDKVAVRRAVATNPSLRLPHLAALVADADPGVRLRLASQSALPDPVALVLAADPSPVVRTHTIATAKTNDDRLLGWAASDEEEVQLALAARPDLPEPVSRLLLLSSAASVRRAARALVAPDPVELLHFVTAGEPDERAWVAARSPLPSALQRLLAQDPDPDVGRTLAGNPSLDGDIADFFLALADEPVCVALATNPALTADQIQALAATRLPGVLTALAYRADLYDELVVFLLEYSPDFLRHWAIQQRPAPLADPALARRLLGHPLPSVRAFAVANHGWRPADFYDFSRDPAPAVRLACVRHPLAPDELLADVATGPDPDLATLAEAARTARAATAAASLKAQLAATRKAAAKPATATRAATPAVRPTPADPARSPRPTTAPAPAAAEPAPKILNQLKRLFWQ